MLNDTRLKYDAYTMQIGKLNSVADTGKSFTVAPAVAQTLRGKIQASSAFLTSINIIPVVAQEGDKVGVGVKGTIASRTDTRIHDRQPRYPGDLDETRYRCEKTNFDTLIRYETLDAWAHQPIFQPLIRDAIVKAKALDIITIGFNGVKVAVETDATAFPLLQDVNIGWLQHIRMDAPARHMAGGNLKEETRNAQGVVTAAGAIYVGPGIVYNEADANDDQAEVDYVNIDALIYDAIELLDENYRDDTDLVVIVGRDLVHDKYFSIVNSAGDKATEQLARDVLLSDKKLGGLQAVRVPKFSTGHAMSLARKLRDRVLASQMASAPVTESGLSLTASASDAGTPAERAAASFAMRLQHDLRRLKEIKSITARISVKREMLPHYHDWIRGLLQGGREANAGIAEEVLPTMMVWLIDIGEYGPALEIAEHVLRYNVPLPSRYERDAAALVVEEIADAAIRAQNAGQPFPIEILELVEGLTHEADMHDQIRAKLNKAIGTELARAAEELDPTKPEFVVAAVRALAPLRQAVRLHDRVGVAGQIKRLEKAITKRAEPAKVDAPTDTAGSTGS